MIDLKVLKAEKSITYALNYFQEGGTFKKFIITHFVLCNIFKRMVYELLLNYYIFNNFLNLKWLHLSIFLRGRHS